MRKIQNKKLLKNPDIIGDYMIRLNPQNDNFVNYSDEMLQDYRIIIKDLMDTSKLNNE